MDSVRGVQDGELRAAVLNGGNADLETGCRPGHFQAQTQTW